MAGLLPSPFTIFSQSQLASLQTTFWNYNGTGFSYPELSHRSAHYAGINIEAVAALRSYFRVPSNFEVLFTTAESAHPSLPFNLTKYPLAYLVRDQQSQHAFLEAQKINPKVVRLSSAQNRKKAVGAQGPFFTVYSRFGFEKGLDWGQLQAQQDQILVCSLTRCAHYLQVDVEKHGLVFFEGGRGIGLTGMCILFIRKDLIGYQTEICPDLLNYEKGLKMLSVINTPYTVVPLLVNAQLSALISEQLYPSKVRVQLSSIKSQFQSQLLSAGLKLIQSNSQGILILHLDSSLDLDRVRQYGIIDGQNLIVMLQLQNRGGAQVFRQKLMA